MSDKYSDKTYPNESGGTTFLIPFSYLRQPNLSVYAGDVLQENGVDFNVNTTTNSVVFVSAVSAGVAVRIKRTTPLSDSDQISRFVSGNPIEKTALDDLQRTSLFFIQEMRDDLDDGLDSIDDFETQVSSDITDFNNEVASDIEDF